MVHKMFEFNMKNLLFWGGVAVVGVTHFQLLSTGLPQALIQQHAMINLGAAAAIVISRFVK